MLHNTEQGVKKTLTTQSIVDYTGLDFGWLGSRLSQRTY